MSVDLQRADRRTALLGGFRWYRRWRGGRWEGWIMDWPILATWWFPVFDWTPRYGTRPHPGCRGTPVREEHG